MDNTPPWEKLKIKMINHAWQLLSEELFDSSKCCFRLPNTVDYVKWPANDNTSRKTAKNERKYQSLSSDQLALTGFREIRSVNSQSVNPIQPKKSQTRPGSHVSWMTNFWCRIFLLPFHLQTPSINFSIGLEENFQKIYTFTLFLSNVSEIKLFE